MGGRSKKSDEPVNNGDGNDTSDDTSAPCKICKIVIPGDGDGLYCEGFCKSWFHPKCIGISDECYNSITVVADNVKWYCEDCNKQVDRVVNSINSIDEYVSLHVTVIKLNKLIDDLVNQQNTTNKRIDEVIELTKLDKSNKIKLQTSMMTDESYRQTKEESTHRGSKYKNKGLKNGNMEEKLPADKKKRETSGNMLAAELTEGGLSNESAQFETNHESSNSSKTTINHVLANEEMSESEVEENSATKVNCNKSFQYRESNFPAIDGGWNLVSTNRRKKEEEKGEIYKGPGKYFQQGRTYRPRTTPKPRPIIGTANISDGLQVAARYSWLFISRLKPTVEEETVKQHVIGICQGDKEVICEKLPTKYNTYSSFKADDDPPHPFSQVFVLKPLNNSFYCQHDIFRLGIHDSA